MFTFDLQRFVAITAGDVMTAVPASVAQAGSMTIQPAAGDEWEINNIYSGEGIKVEVYRTDGTHPIKILTTDEGVLNTVIRVTNTNYITVKNVSGKAAYMSYDAQATKAAAA